MRLIAVSRQQVTIHLLQKKKTTAAQAYEKEATGHCEARNNLFRPVQIYWKSNNCRCGD